MLKGLSNLYFASSAFAPERQIYYLPTVSCKASRHDSLSSTNTLCQLCLLTPADDRGASTSHQHPRPLQRSREMATKECRPGSWLHMPWKSRSSRSIKNLKIVRWPQASTTLLQRLGVLREQQAAKGSEFVSFPHRSSRCSVAERSVTAMEVGGRNFCMDTGSEHRGPLPANWCAICPNARMRQSPAFREAYQLLCRSRDLAPRRLA